MMRTASVMAALVLLAPAVCAPAAGGEAQVPEAGPERDWALSFTPYLWIAGFQFTAGGLEVYSNFREIAGLANGVFMLDGNFQWRFLLVSFDGIYLDLGKDTSFGPFDLSFNLDLKMMRPRVGFRLYERALESCGGRTGLRAVVGARYWSMEPGVAFTYHPIIGGDEPETSEAEFADSWWDPLLGISGEFRVTDLVGLEADLEVGGFGVGDASDFTWDFSALASFRVWKYISVHAGYKRISLQRTVGEGDEAADVELDIDGTFVGLSLFY
jgi:hypothetical protein